MGDRSQRSGLAWRAERDGSRRTANGGARRPRSMDENGMSPDFGRAIAGTIGQAHRNRVPSEPHAGPYVRGRSSERNAARSAHAADRAVRSGRSLADMAARISPE
ncbi:hypothetical protein C7S16_0960 [Burkholderia thailandensis]|uniref:Uncharacterized protein n=1 Tax=Burkholderia thailandensis TaxID=57975 RepID=A0AAW9D2B0_BURTH|nr:hypothetical protein [Burkholderia thailandensis]MDW9254214.1 hypothetical protein [Burkholderia thailandensis]